MKSTVILTALLSMILLSCAKEAPKVKHKKTMHSSGEVLKNIQIVNTEDPVCHMNMPEYLKDTAEYHHQTYGFCSTFCKDEFVKKPQQYVKQ
ncbi:YHS domain-containing protein [Chryseobacterium sp. GMJ5]|uniref:YHS domain-containing protein n=1 Tax=Chryseobacterium gilvum TaxID=2976534 RepID=A0ABT2VW52_9FLAO|nr:YHS domain-containing protein [Chryseobacterium gilvum]MCU7614227.1 YHS domain-containing protein [Chryseobacterium gilvum]